ncbi:MAG: Peptidase S8 and S53 subtilisin kexin sedolisin [uncultured Thiotrichaceae bacterium]|uniref:Peptidase S8 and S53 subtilisin kexin sedolisin n=1 Tax=uncultured Thiotrichaceae bacterium TaxID=298394 RepID=A0A6S6SUE3_9GAMM|nr:MAG: Peptidase S8 and S53 subtilisin kexin sedolisin [uncultured Thiotrichaceae bacterium]
MAANVHADWIPADVAECYFQDTLCFDLPEKRDNYNKNEILLLFKKDFPQGLVKQVMKDHGLESLSVNALDSMNLKLQVASTNGQDPLEIEKKINRVYEEIEATTNNEYFTNASGVKKTSIGVYPKSLTGASRALTLSNGENILIGMVDGPVDIKHKDLKGKVIQHSLVDFNPESVAEMHHGTTIAGVLVSSNDRIGIAPNARLLSVSAFEYTDENKARSSSAQVAQAIDYAISKKVDILNLSFSGGKDTLVKRMIKKAADQGIVIVASSGNNNTDEPKYPAAYPRVITVTAVDHFSERYKMANRGKHIDLAAPGVGIMTIAPGDRYDFATGTSIAAAHVSGSIALFMSKNKRLDRLLITETAKDLGKPGHDIDYGDGLLNIYSALERVVKR